MEGLSLGVPMPPFDEQLISSLVFKSLSLIPSTNEKKVALSASITIKINSPLGPHSPLDIKSINMSVFLSYENSSVGTLDVFQAPVKQLNENTCESQFNDNYLILSDLGTTYGQFAQNFIRANKTHPINFRIIGFASITGSFALGSLDIDGIPIENSVSLVGLESLSNIRIHGISVDGETENALQFSINATIGNPGVTDVQLQDFTLQMADNDSDTVLGQVPINVLSLRPGNNDIFLHGFVHFLFLCP